MVRQGCHCRGVIFCCLTLLLTRLITTCFEQVDGREIPLPIQLKNGISIEVLNGKLVIKTKAVIMSYSQSQITVTVSDGVAQYVCGACGKLTDKTEGINFASPIQSYLNGYRSSVFDFW